MSADDPVERLAWFKSRVDALAAVIDAPAQTLPTYGRTEDFARPHIEFRDGQFHFVIVERGQELERISSADPEKILFHVFEAATFSMAVDYEVDHRRRGQDFRRLMFEKRLELLEKLSPAWRDRVNEELAEVLRKFPYVDAAGQ